MYYIFVHNYYDTEPKVIESSNELSAIAKLANHLKISASKIVDNYHITETELIK